MAKVKGTLLIDYVRLIKTNKDKNWKQYFTEEDSKVVFGSVLSTFWYPIEIFEHLGKAVFKEIAQGKLELARLWGRFVIEDQGNRYYPSLIRFNDPLGSLERIRDFIQQWFQFDDPGFQAVEIVHEAKNRLKMIIRDDHPYDFFEAFVHQLAGEFERMVELNGGKEVEVKITEHDYTATQPSATIMVSWK